MGTFFVYILKSAVCLALFYLFHRLLLSRETFHRFNRFALLGLLALAAFLPLVQVSVERPAEVQQAMLTLEQLLLMADAMNTPHTVGAEAVGAASATMSVHWVEVALLVYAVGILFFLVRNLYSLARLGVLLRKSRREPLGRYLATEAQATLLVHEREIAPFSWMGYIVISRNDLEENGREILTHELAHIRQRHSLDLLVADLCIFLQWFNPAAWLLKQELQNIHEYEADDTVINAGIDAKRYQLLLIKKAVGTRLYSMSNSFNHSKLKKRITMMMKEKSNPWARMKYLYVLPLAAIAVTVFARPELSNVTNEIAQVSADKVSELAAHMETKVEKSAPTEPEKKKMSMAIKHDGRLQVTNTDNAVVQDTAVKTIDKVGGITVVGYSGKVLDEDPVFEVVEQMPQYPDGGMSGLMRFFGRTIKYPVEAQKAGREGRAVVQFIVNKDGSTGDYKILQGVSPEIDAEAIRVVSMMPKWIPGKQRGKAVRVKYTVPIMFRLEPVVDKSKVKVYPAVRADGSSLLYIVNGKIVPEEIFRAISPDKIQSVTVIQDSTAILEFGEAAKGKAGVIDMTLKREDNGSSNGGAMKLQADTLKVVGVKTMRKAPETVDAGEGFAILEGTVTDKKGVPIIGAIAQIKDTNRGTVTDRDGKFILRIPLKKMCDISISYIGMKTLNISLAGGNKKDARFTLSYVMTEE